MAATTPTSAACGPTRCRWTPRSSPPCRRPCRGQCYGGQLLGEARVEFGAGLRYDVDLKAIGVRLDEVARHNRIGGNAQLEGLAKAELYLKGTGNGLDELEGGGNLHVPRG